MAEGQTLCVEGITRNPANAKQVTIPLDPLTYVAFNSGDVLSFRVFVRIGTNPDGSRCSGHANATGLRLYYDAESRPSKLMAKIKSAPMANYFMHSTGGSYFLDDLSPTGAVKYKDSTGVNYNNGNPWKEIGTWNMQVP